MVAVLEVQAELSVGLGLLLPQSLAAPNVNLSLLRWQPTQSLPDKQRLIFIRMAPEGVVVYAVVRSP